MADDDMEYKMKKIFVIAGVWMMVLCLSLSQAVAEEPEMDVQWHEPSSSEGPPAGAAPANPWGFMLERGTYSHRRFGRAHGNEGMWRIHWMPTPGVGIHGVIRSTDRLRHQDGVDNIAFLLGLTFNNLGGVNLTQFAPGFDLYLLGPRFHAEIGPTADFDLFMSLGVAPLGLRATWCGSVRPFLELRAFETSISMVVLEANDDHDTLGFLSVGASLGAGIIF